MNYDYMINLSKIDNISKNFTNYCNDFLNTISTLESSEFANCSDSKIIEIYRQVLNEFEKVKNINNEIDTTLINYIEEIRSKERELASLKSSSMPSLLEFIGSTGNGEISDIFNEKFIPLTSAIEKNNIDAIKKETTHLEEYGEEYKLFEPTKLTKENYLENDTYTHWMKYYKNKKKSKVLQCTAYVAGRIEETTGYKVPNYMGNGDNWAKNGEEKYGFKRIDNFEDIEAGDAVSVRKIEEVAKKVNGKWITTYEALPHIIFCEGRNANGELMFSDGNTSVHEWGSVHTFDEWSKNGWEFVGAVDIHNVVNGYYKPSKYNLEESK